MSTEVEEEQVDPPGPVAGGLAQDDGEGERPEGEGPEEQAREVEPGPDRDRSSRGARWWR